MNEINYISGLINKEINELESYKKELRKFFLKESLKGNIRGVDFNRIVNEIERIALEINYLKISKSEYSNLKELNDKRY